MGGSSNESVDEREPCPAVAISIIVCTRNRAALLDRCLAGVAGTIGVRDTEIVVVNNGSTDHTAEVTERWAESLPVRHVREPRTGLSHARNRALSEARGRVMAFLDDDVAVSSGWLGGVERAFAGSDRVGGAAGRVDLAWPHGRPTWLPPSREVWFARLDLGRSPRPLGAREHPVGANMAVTRSAADAAGGFDPTLGYSGKRLLGNEEVDFMERVRAAGYDIVYEPSMCVEHLIDSDRLSRRYLLRRIYAQGRSDVRMRANGDEGRAESLRCAADAFSHAGIVGWRSDVRRLRAEGDWQAKLVDVSAGRAKHLGRAREHVARALRRDARNSGTPPHSDERHRPDAHSEPAERPQSDEDRQA